VGVHPENRFGTHFQARPNGKRNHWRGKTGPIDPTTRRTSLAKKTIRGVERAMPSYPNNSRIVEPEHKPEIKTKRGERLTRNSKDNAFPGGQWTDSHLLPKRKEALPRIESVKREKDLADRISGCLGSQRTPGRVARKTAG